MNKSFEDIYNEQINIQKMISKKGLYDKYLINIPCDDIDLFKYHVVHLLSELGEVLESDKRWKNYRDEKYDEKSKKEEIADCFIVLMNIAMYSNLTSGELLETINKKLLENKKRLLEFNFEL